MEPSSQPQLTMDTAANGSQVYHAFAYAPATTVATPAITSASLQFPATPAHMSAQHQTANQQAQQFLQQQQKQQLQQFWVEHMTEIEARTDFKNHNLPLVRIKKIMKADEDVHMVSAEAPVIFAKACEIFIQELTLRSWMHTKENKRRTLQKNDIAKTITRTDIYDFLVDIVSRDEMKEDGVGLPRVGLPPMGAPSDAYPYYYMPQQQVLGPRMVYGARQSQPMTYLWLEPQEHQLQAPEEQQSLHKSG